MSRSMFRVQLSRAYVLHQRPFRDSSLIVEVFARDHGRLTVFAHAARGPRSRFGTLQPFRALLLSWSGRGEAPTLSAAERADMPAGAMADAAGLPAARLMSGFYLNELLLKLLTRHDPHPDLFDQYEATLGQLCRSPSAEAPLRVFETRLLEFIGYGLNLAAEADTGQPVRPDGHYHFRPGVHGFVVAEPASPGAIPGHLLHGLAAGCEPIGEGQLRQARALMRAALDHCLEGRELATRTVARSLAGYPRKERTA
ncbi:MAG TPA: DNA repair protein RecO [Steroidobacteraceae bacterium]|jgi:DNA repair protein RecO (recombination protein O)|nr:DNA repair protein RecO [Steroidobacteraceae bacterium]